MQKKIQGYVKSITKKSYYDFMSSIISESLKIKNIEQHERESIVVSILLRSTLSMLNELINITSDDEDDGNLIFIKEQINELWPEEKKGLVDKCFKI